MAKTRTKTGQVELPDLAPTASSDLATIPETPKPRWRVHLTHHDEVEVEAADKDAAYEAYKRRFGILASDHQPTITPVGA